MNCNDTPRERVWQMMSEADKTVTDAGRRMSRLLTGIASQAVADLAHIGLNRAGGVHALRRRMKKLQSMLLLVRDLVSARTMLAIKKRMRFLKDAFAGQRDRDVMTQLAFEIGGDELASRLGLAASKRHTLPTAKHALAAREMARLMKGVYLDALTSKEVADAYDRASRKARKTWRAAIKNPIQERFHEWRKRTKTLYFQILLLHPQTGRMKNQLNVSRQLGHWLGQLHDLDTLLNLVRKCGGMTDQKSQGEILRRQAKLRHRIFRGGASLHQKTGERASRQAIREFAA